MILEGVRGQMFLRQLNNFLKHFIGFPGATRLQISSYVGGPQSVNSTTWRFSGSSTEFATR